MLNRRSFVATTLAVAATPAVAQNAPWPGKPIKLVVPYAPGGTTDVVARMIAEHLGQKLGQNIIVDNKPGIKPFWEVTEEDQRRSLEATRFCQESRRGVRMPQAKSAFPLRIRSSNAGRSVGSFWPSPSIMAA